MSLTDIEKILLQREAEREAKSKEGWFATKPSTFAHNNLRETKEAVQTIMRREKKQLLSSANPEDLEPVMPPPLKRRKGERSAYYFVLNHFERLDKLIPEDPDMDDITRTTQVNDIVKLFRDMAHVPDTEGDLVAWQIISKIFSSRYQELKRDKGII